MSYKTLFILLPLAVGVGCGGCDPIDTGDSIVDTGETGDTDTTPVDFEATFRVNPPVDGATLSAVYVRQEEDYPEDIECSEFPCSHIVDEVGEWMIEAERGDYLFTDLDKTLVAEDDGKTFDMAWTEESSHGVYIPEGWTYVECDENGEDCDDEEEYIYTEISHEVTDYFPEGRAHIVMWGLRNGMPISGYSFDYDESGSGGYHWIGTISENRQMVYYEKWNGETLVQSKYLWKL